MPFEVYTGAKPGRPGLLLVVGAGLLAGTLGLAWWQVLKTRALGPEQRVGDTPLLVRPPKGWRPDPRNPQRFILPIGRKGRRAVVEYERRIQFDFTRLPAFQPVDQLLPLLGLDDPGDWRTLQSARIGEYEAVQAHTVRLRRYRGRTVKESEKLVRFTCLPRGHLITVAYDPLGDLRPADVAILEQVCQTLRVDEPTLGRAPEEYLARAGLTLPLEEGWLVVGADFEEVPGIFIGGLLSEGPAWSIGVLRTWLAGGRTPRDLLADFAAERWLKWDVENLIREARRVDGTTVTTIRHPKFGKSSPSISSAWVVQQSSSRAVIMFVYAGSREAERADQAAQRIAAALEIAPLDAIPAVEEAQAAGVALVKDLRRRGPAPRWGRESADTTYRRLDHDETVIVRRSALGRDPAQGYEGSLWRRIGQTREERIGWTIDGLAAAYTWQADFFYGRSSIHIVEQRAPASGVVVRHVFVDEREEQRWTFTPGTGFVPPPAESIIEGWVARREAGAAVVKMSSPLGPGAHTVLLRHLPPDGEYPRVLVQQDYWPLGGIAAFDDARGETHYEVYPTAAYRRVKPR